MINSRRLAALSFVWALLAAAIPAGAADKVNVGVLRFVSSGGLFLAQERGYFKDEGLDVSFTYFEAAQPISVAVASGDINFGITAITGGTLNLAGKGAVKMIASQGAERKGFKGNTFVVSNAAFARGITSLDKLPGASIAITQVGSSQHYMMGQIAAAQKFEMDKIVLKPLQGVPNMVAAVKSGQVDGALLAPIFARPLIERGEVKFLANFSDVANYQYGAVFASPKLVSENAALAQRFVRAYVKGNADYAKAFLRQDAKGDAVVDAETQAAAELIAKYVAPSETPEKGAANVIAAAVYVEATGKLDVADIDQQIAWYKKEKLVNDNVNSSAFVDMSFAR